MKEKHPHASQRRGWRSSSILFLATGMGIGLVVPAPGTIGALWGIPLVLLLDELSLVSQVLVGLAIVGLGVPLTSQAARLLGGQKDPGAIVFDEIASLPVTFFLVSPGGTLPWKVLVLGFMLNRTFDITKPPPIRHLERLPGGWGIMADDLAAGVCSCLTLHGALWLDHWMGWRLLSLTAG